MKTSDFDFNIPPELIAHAPSDKRDHSRLMVLSRSDRSILHKHFYDLIDYFQPGDLLVLNDTKVLPANLKGIKEEGGSKVEVLLVKRLEPCLPAGRLGVGRQKWECLVKPGKRLSVGSRVIFGDGEVVGTVLKKTESGEQIIEFEGDLNKYMHTHGELPLPPYIKVNPKSQIPNSRPRTPNSDLGKRYQTVYADKEGASAAPTAGLHFTPELMEKIKTKGVNIAYVTLHTGLATFKPVYAENVEDHTMYYEEYEVPPETLEALGKAKRVIAVGTTSVRTLESLGRRTSEQRTVDRKGIKGQTNLFIYPGYKFKVVDAIITNFHWPRTSLIMLVSAFAGKDFIMKAYQEAIDQKYRFFSFGDAMLII